MREEHPDVTAQDGAGSAVLREMREQAPVLSTLIFAWAHLRLRGFPAARLTAEDVVQETWMRAFTACARRAEALPDAGALRPWLIGIARNVVLEEVRRPEGQSRSVSTTLASELHDTVTSLCTHLARNELVQQFLAFAAGLEEVDRQLLVRCGLEDERPGDVALRLDMEPPSAVRRWHRLRERLREARWDERWGL
jgi:RNA polymerase sigma factor (sigma-70 family)